MFEVRAKSSEGEILGFEEGSDVVKALGVARNEEDFEPGDFEVLDGGEELLFFGGVGGTDNEDGVSFLDAEVLSEGGCFDGAHLFCGDIEFEVAGGVEFVWGNA